MRMSHDKQQGSSTEESRFTRGQAYRSLRSITTFQPKKDKSKVSIVLFTCVLHGRYILDCVSYNSDSGSYVPFHDSYILVHVPVHGINTNDF